MNRTHLEHVVAALLIMAAVSGLFYLLEQPAGHWIGAAAGVFFFLGREYTQGERYIAHRVSLHISHLRWYDGLRVWRWTRDGQLDLLCPLLACLAAALVVQWAPLLR